ncbi:MAG: Tad domain-containing protein [Proteobacteria bacterium]|nr:Tad domain-containing protein [Pseudomonadota bacterium]
MNAKIFNKLQLQPALNATRLMGRFCRETGGAMAILVALLMPMVIGMMGLTVDVGVWYAEKRSLQDTTDAASLAGGFEIANGADSTSVIAAAEADAARNDYDPETDEIFVNNPPTSGPNAGNDGSVEVIITRQMPLFFTTAFFKLIGATTRMFNATARSVVNTDFEDEFCILGLNPGNVVGVSVTGNGTATLDCGVAVNAQGNSALNVQGNATLTTTSITTIGSIGPGGGTINSTSPPRRQNNPIADPYGTLDTPDFAGTGFLNPPVIGVNNKGEDVFEDIDEDCDRGTIKKGYTATDDLDASDFGGTMVICGDLTFEAGTTINLAPGIYIINQGDFKINANASVIGDDVTIILTSSDNANDTGRFQVNGGASIELSAPTTDPAGAPGFSGVLFYQDRIAPNCTVNCNVFNGGSELDLEGALYFPSQDLSFSGGSSIGDGCTQLVASTVSIGGDAGLQTNCSDSGTRSIGRLRASLGE